MKITNLTLPGHRHMTFIAIEKNGYMYARNQVIIFPSEENRYIYIYIYIWHLSRLKLASVTYVLERCTHSSKRDFCIQLFNMHEWWDVLTTKSFLRLWKNIESCLYFFLQQFHLLTCVVFKCNLWTQCPQLTSIVMFSQVNWYSWRRSSHR